MWLPGLEKKYRADIIIANGENIADGKGCTEKEGKFLIIAKCESYHRR
jgi:calcineurin-like phosphoesterase